jgi:uncharacterized membrane protein (UPF0127 family)
MMRDMIFSCRIALLLIILFTCTACAGGNTWVELKGQRFTVEIADDRDEQALGLMFRESMADDHGMLFIFQNDARRSFWMKNTRIPLDIIYFDGERRLINVQQAKPCRTEQCPGYPSTQPARYVLELNAGKARELSLEPGDLLIISSEQEP